MFILCMRESVCDLGEVTQGMTAEVNLEACHPLLSIVLISSAVIYIW
jgi:hypothetical protein